MTLPHPRGRYAHLVTPAHIQSGSCLYLNDTLFTAPVTPAFNIRVYTGRNYNIIM